MARGGPAFSGFDVEFLIRGDTTDPIEWVLVDGDNGPGYWSKLRIRGASGNFDIPSIDKVGFAIGHGGGDIWIAEMKTSGDVGSVSAHRINDLQVLGDLVGDIYIDTALAIVSGIDQIEIGGDLLGDIYCGSGFIGTIDVTGVIGQPFPPSYIESCGGIVRIEAASINAGINAGGFLCPGILGRLATTSGDFVGSLLCNGLGGINSNDAFTLPGTATWV